MSTKPLTVGSLFSGVGGFDLGLEAAGMEVRWQVEIDPQARAVLRRHWPKAKLHGDVNDVGRSNLAPVDLICGGFPCQDLSVAGRRGGLAGERSGLFYEFMRIVDELAPRWVLIENVPGLLSSNGGRDMGAVVGTLGELGYGWTYRVLDLQHLGAPQRRRRVFIVGCAGGVCPPEVLFEPASLPGDPPTRTETRQGAASRTVRRSVASGRVAGEDGAGGAAGDPVSAFGRNNTSGPIATSHALSAHGGPQGRLDFETETFLVGALQAHAARHGHAMTTQQAAESGQIIAHAYNAERGLAPHGSMNGSQVVPALSENERKGHSFVTHPAAVGFDLTGSTVDDSTEAFPTLRRRAGGAAGHGAAVAFTERGRKDGRSCEHQEGIAYSLNNPGKGSRSTNERLVAAHAIPRRLTPKECERLMGWPDNWTAYGIGDGRQEIIHKDGPRYRMCGNGIGAPVAEWIARRIVEADAALRESEAA